MNSKFWCQTFVVHIYNMNIAGGNGRNDFDGEESEVNGLIFRGNLHILPRALKQTAGNIMRQTPLRWIGDAKAESIYYVNYSTAPQFHLFSIPLFHISSKDLNIQHTLKDNSDQLLIWHIVQKYFYQPLSDSVLIFIWLQQSWYRLCRCRSTYPKECH